MQSECIRHHCGRSEYKQRKLVIFWRAFNSCKCLALPFLVCKGRVLSCLASPRRYKAIELLMHAALAAQPHSRQQQSKANKQCFSCFHWPTLGCHSCRSMSPESHHVLIGCHTASAATLVLPSSAPPRMLGLIKLIICSGHNACLHTAAISKATKVMSRLSSTHRVGLQDMAIIQADSSGSDNADKQILAPHQAHLSLAAFASQAPYYQGSNDNYMYWVMISTHVPSMVTVAGVQRMCTWQPHLHNCQPHSTLPLCHKHMV